MTSLLDALKKLATDGSAESISDAHGIAAPREPRGQTPAIVTAPPKISPKRDLLDQCSDHGSPLAENELEIPRLYLNRPLSVVYEDHPRRGEDSERLPGSHPPELGVELYHQPVVRQPLGPTGLESESARTAVDAVLRGGPASMDESPVDLLESPFMNRESRGDTTPPRFETPRDASRGQGYGVGPGHEIDFDALADLGAGSAATRTPDPTVMAADIPDLWRILARNSFDVKPSDGVADQGNYCAHGGFADGPRSTDNAGNMDPPRTTPKPTISQDVRHDIHDGEIQNGDMKDHKIKDDEIKDILRQCCTNVECPKSTEAVAAEATAPKSAFPAAPRSAPPSGEVSSAVVVSKSVGAPVVPRRVAATRPAKTEFEKLLHTMILNKRQGPQIASLHRRIQQIVPHPGSCGIVAVQRDAHVAEVIGCVGSLHLATGNRVLLVDANPDLRRLTDGLELGHLAGLSDVCTGACTYQAAVHHTSTTGLSVMPLGTTMELMVNWSAVTSVLREATRGYGLVLVDMGHALGESTMSVAEACDRILLHVHLGKTHRETARNVADLFFSNNLTVSGLVVTNLSADRQS